MGLHLSEKDARLLATRIVDELHKMGAVVREFGVHLEREGFYFLADINGRQVMCQTGQGNFTYQAVARELLGAGIDLSAPPELIIQKES